MVKGGGKGGGKDQTNRGHGHKRGGPDRPGSKRKGGEGDGKNQQEIFREQ